VVREHPGEYIAVVEGAIPTADDGVYCTIAGRTALDIAKHVCSKAAINIAPGPAVPNPASGIWTAAAHPGVPGVPGAWTFATNLDPQLLTDVFVLMQFRAS
jgi:hydrogenase small subunit